MRINQQRLTTRRTTPPWSSTCTDINAFEPTHYENTEGKNVTTLATLLQSTAHAFVVGWPPVCAGNPLHATCRSVCSDVRLTEPSRMDMGHLGNTTHNRVSP